MLFSWEIFVGLFYFFLWLYLLIIKAIKKRFVSEYHLLCYLNRVLLFQIPMKAAKDAVEPISKAMAISISEVGEKETVSLVYEPQILKLKFE